MGSVARYALISFSGEAFRSLVRLLTRRFRGGFFVPRSSMVMLAKASFAEGFARIFFRFRIGLSMAVVFSAKVNAATRFSPLVQVDH